MSVANDLALPVEVLWGGVICVCRVGEGARCKVGHLNLNIESGEWLQDLSWLWIDDHARNHLVLGGDFPHNYI